MILKAGIESGYQSVMELVDAGVPRPLLEPMKQTILQVEGVMGCHRLRGRRAGSCIYLDVDIEVDPFSSWSAAHDIGETVRHQIQSSHAEVAEVFIHLDPAVSQVSPSVADQQHEGACPNVILEQKDIKRIVHDVLPSKFSEIMFVERVTTHHSLQSKLLLRIEVSVASDMLIRDALEVAKEAEKEILKATPHVNQVFIQLTLDQPIPQRKLND